ncbi:hypothetical protein C4K18_3926 [Pseudomonas chlororaphis subsp. aurantiaca]|nr:hypothetical protein C4K18_3926 [Pseudomonas chlororaphis subsp. aurantiaca]
MAFINDKQAAAVVRFWREAGASQWFAKDPVFDQRFRELFSIGIGRWCEVNTRFGGIRPRVRWRC